MSFDGKGMFTQEQMQAARDLRAARSTRTATRGDKSGPSDQGQAACRVSPAPTKSGPSKISTEAAVVKEKDDSSEEDLMDMRTPVQTTGFLSAVVPKTAGTDASPPFAGPTQVSSTLLDSSIEGDEIGIKALKPRQSAAVVDKALNKRLLEKLGGLAKSKWAN